ncbi:hypothetical protein HY620_00450 [Candidatus Uhrbacteria bacterium]|nr:hypothetical protein [Candidatus Uhrbacteria bacterium]
MAHHKFFRLIGVFILFFGIFLAFHFSIPELWTKDDPYYHARHSALIAETGNLTLVDPWIRFHILSYAPTDLWWGFHLLQALGIKLFGVIAGVKVVAAFLSSIVFTVFYAILVSAGVQKAFVWTTLYFASSSMFLLRLMLERPHVLGIIFVPLCWWLAVQRRSILLYLLSVVYALSYEISPYLLGIFAFLALCEYIIRRDTLHIRSLAISGLGIITGFLLHPNSFHYFYGSFVSYFQILWLRFSGVRLMVGDEVQQADISYLFLYNTATIVGFALALGAFFAVKSLRNAERSVIIFQLLTMSVVWFFVYLAVPRAVEYWIPFTWLFIVLTLDTLSKMPEWKLIHGKLQKLQGSFLQYTVSICIFGVFAWNLAQIIFEIPNRSSELYFHGVKEVAKWLKKETPKGSTVFFDSWGYWPMLFYYNQHNTYIMGMDPTFLYVYDPRMYWLWHHVVFSGEACDTAQLCTDKSHERVQSIAPTIRNVFNASYVLVRKTDSEEKESFFNKHLQSQKKSFIKVFETDRYMVYAVKQTVIPAQAGIQR